MADFAEPYGYLAKPFTNAPCRMLYINTYTENLTGLSNAEMLLNPLSDILHFSDMNDFSPELLGQSVHYGEEDAVFLTDRNGENIMVRVRIIPRKYRDEYTFGSIISIKEIPDGKLDRARDVGTLCGPDVRGASA